jgi:hypothetical protein
MEQTAARPKNGRPLQNLSLVTLRGFVAVVPFTVSVHGEPSRAFRDGTGIFKIKLSHYQGSQEWKSCDYLSLLYAPCGVR